MMSQGDNINTSAKMLGGLSLESGTLIIRPH